jgi:hypothetical protein
VNAQRVKALIVGGYAVAFHAKPRFTNDIDLLVEPQPDNAEHRHRERGVEWMNPFDT